MQILPLTKQEFIALTDKVEDMGYEHVAKGLRELPNYRFQSEWRFNKAMGSLIGAADAAVAGMENQVMIRLKTFIEIFGFDNSCQLVGIGQGLGLPVKVFAKLSGRSKRISGPKFDWHLFPESEYEQQIPDEVIRNVATLSRHIGLTLRPLSIVVPIPKPVPTKEVKREEKDPVILLHRGPFLLELGRWE